MNRGTKDKPQWYGKFKDVDGKWKRKNTHQLTKTAAQRLADEWEARAARGLAGIVEPGSPETVARTITLRALAEMFIQEYSRPKMHSPARYRRGARAAFNQRVFPYPIADMAVSSIKPIHVEKLRDRLRDDGYANPTINQSLVYIQTAINWAKDREIIDCRNPVKGVEFMPEQPTAEPFSRDEVYRLLDPAHRRPMVAAALFTGMRKGELFGLTWPCVRLDLSPPRIEIKRSYNGPPKGGKPRAIPLHPELVPILEEWRQRCPKALHPGPADPVAFAWTGGKDEPLIFPVEVAAGWRMGHESDMEAIGELLTRAGCHAPSRAPWHTLRHTFATHFAESGGALPALELILGHSPGMNRNPITAGYTHLGLEFVAREIERLTFAPPPDWQPPPDGVTSIGGPRRTRVKRAAVRTGDLMTSAELGALLGYDTTTRSGMDAFKAFRMRHPALNETGKRVSGRWCWRRVDALRWIAENPPKRQFASRGRRGAAQQAA